MPEASAAFGGGALFIDCVTGTTVAEITGGTFTGNSAPNGFGGAIYTQDGTQVKIKNPCFFRNSARTDGGGIWNCATGSGDYYAFHGMYMAENTAGDQGDDFYSMPKQHASAKVYLTDYTFSGEKCDWRYDDGSLLNGSLAPNSYYQESATEIAVKSSLTGTTTASVSFSQNSAGQASGAVANNEYCKSAKRRRSPSRRLRRPQSRRALDRACGVVSAGAACEQTDPKARRGLSARMGNRFAT